MEKVWKQIDEHQPDEVRRSFALAHRFLTEGDPDVRNAVAVSYVEHLHFADGIVRRSWAEELLTPLLREVYLEVTGQGPSQGTA